MSWPHSDKTPWSIRLRAQLRKFQTVDGVQYTTADIGPALTMLEVTGRLQRAAVTHGNPRPGWLPGAALEARDEGATATRAEVLITL
jgi:hypothetical protein